MFFCGRLIWQWRREPLPDPQTAILRAQVDSLKQQSAGPLATHTSQQVGESNSQKLPTEQDVLINRLLFKQKQAQLFKEDLGKKVTELQKLSTQTLEQYRMWAGIRAMGVPPGRTDLMWKEGIKNLQSLCDAYFGDNQVALMPSEPTAGQIAMSVPGDSDLTDPDGKVRYRIFYLRKSEFDSKVRRLTERLESETNEVDRQIREMK